jgi:hypothetical protein
MANMRNAKSRGEVFRPNQLRFAADLIILHLGLCAIKNNLIMSLAQLIAQAGKA